MNAKVSVEQIEQDFHNLMVVNFATLDHIFKKRISAGGIPGDVLAALELLHTKCISEMKEIVEK